MRETDRHTEPQCAGAETDPKVGRHPSSIPRILVMERENQLLKDGFDLLTHTIAWKYMCREREEGGGESPGTGSHGAL